MLSEDSIVLNTIRDLMPTNMSCYLLKFLSTIPYFNGKFNSMLLQNSNPNSNMTEISIQTVFINIKEFIPNNA